MVRQRSKTIAHHQLPPDWTPREVQTWLAVMKQIQQAKDEFKKVVLVTGVFDLFHIEHERFLQKARASGNFLIAGVESDVRVRQLKGPDRPVHTQAERIKDVLSSGVVDVAVVLPEAFDRPEHHRSLISLLRPHILAVSSNTPYIEAKRQLMELFGGELRIVHELNPEVSTTQILAKKFASK
jgi:cytidyltransferase-like protein